MEIAPNVFRFDTGPFNWYLVREGDRLTLIDAGFAGHYLAFTDGLRSIGHTVQDVAGILLTHAHADHMGFAERVRREAGATVYVHENDRIAACRPLQLPWWGLLSNGWRPFVSSILLHATVNGVFFAPCIQSVKTVSDGDSVNVPGNPRVIHVPGHTPGEVVYHFPKSKVTVMGDTLVTLNLMTGRHGNPQVPHRLLNGDDKRSRQSLDRLSELGETIMLPGHGKPWKGSMHEAIGHARKA